MRSIQDNYLQCTNINRINIQNSTKTSRILIKGKISTQNRHIGSYTDEFRTTQEVCYSESLNQKFNKHSYEGCWEYKGEKTDERTQGKKNDRLWKYVTKMVKTR